MGDIETERTDEGKVYSFQKMNFRYKYSKKFLKNKTVLDVGCGYGYGAELLKKFDYTGVDYYNKAIEKAQKKYPKSKFLQMEIPPLKFFDNTFDNVVCLEVIEHVPEEKGMEMLKEIYRVLKNGGILFLSTPNGDNRDELMDNHFIEYGSEQLQALMKKNGFKIKYVGGLSIPFIFGYKKYPVWLKEWYGTSGENKSKLKEVMTQSNIAKDSLIKRLFTLVGMIGIKIFGVLMIYSGYLFPQKAEYQILVCEK